ncbi:MAG: carboxylesterase/lipase family protein [Prevotella sp.]|jgi:para-nitrobenzyl esterase
MNISQFIVETLLGYKCKRDFKRLESLMTSLYGKNEVLGEDDAKQPFAAKTHNGIFVGQCVDGVLSYKGIPYAQPPVGDLRWRAPQPAPESNVVRQAFYFGKSAIQTKSPKLRASFYPQSEDCLTLNIWTAQTDDLSSAKRPVMVFIHGGNYCWGGTSDPLFDGHNFVVAHPGVVLVTINYRLAIMGFLDLTNFKGGEDYKDSCNLGLLDQIEALRWIHRNISNFGGDADNVTIFGESAGGGSVSLLPLIDSAKGLFRRAIVESGSPAFTCTKEDAKFLTNRMRELTGIDSVDQLMKLSERQLMRLNQLVGVHNRFPMRDGRIIPLDPYASYREGKAKDVDLLIGTNKDESRYWIYNFGSLTLFRLGLNVWYENIVKGLRKSEKAKLDSFTMRYPKGKFWGRVELINELMFRIPAIETAAAHASSGGKTFMYYWTQQAAMSHVGACHCVELAYVFNNLDETIYTGPGINVELAHEVQRMWVNFAKTGNPSTDAHPWPEYDSKSRDTLLLGKQICDFEDPHPQQRMLVKPLVSRYISTLFDRLDLNVPYIRKWVVGAVATAILTTAFAKHICNSKNKH